jgi:ketosteroid isomerase-like protein
MSEQILSLVRHVYETWNADGVAGLEPWLAADVELSDAPEMPDARAWRGRAAVIARLGEVSEAVGGGWADLRRFEAHGDRVIVDMVWQEGPEASSPAFGELSHVVRVTDGRIVSIHVFLARSAAEAEAGA